MPNISFKRGLQTDYNKTSSKDPNALYFCTDSGNFYLGESQMGNSDVYTKSESDGRYAPIKFLSNYYLSKVSATSANLITEKPVVSSNNYLELLNTTNQTIAFGGTQKIIINRTVSDVVELDSSDGYDVTLSLSFSRNCDVEFGTRVFINDQQVSSDRAYGSNNYSGSNAYNTTSAIVHDLKLSIPFDKLSSPIKVNPTSVIRIELFKKQANNQSLSTRLFTGMTIDGSDRFSFVQFNFSSININTSQIADGAITKIKLNPLLQSSIDRADSAVQTAKLGNTVVTKVGTELQFPAYPTSLPPSSHTLDSHEGTLSRNKLDVSTQTSLDKIDNLQVGGVNLLDDSEKLRSSTRFLTVYVKDTLSNYVGRNVVFSFEGKINDDGIERDIYVYPFQESGISIKDNKYMPFTKEWQRFTLQTTAYDWGQKEGLTEGEIAFYDTAGNNNYSIRKLKIEQGTIPTTWSKSINDQELLANDALQQLNNIADSTKLTPQEKLQIRKEWEEIQTIYQKNLAQGKEIGVSTSAYTSAYTVLYSYVTPLLTSMSTVSTIVGSTFNNLFTSFYGANADLNNAISNKLNKPIAGNNLFVNSNYQIIASNKEIITTVQLSKALQEGKQYTIVCEYGNNSPGLSLCTTDDLSPLANFTKLGTNLDTITFTAIRNTDNLVFYNEFGDYTSVFFACLYEGDVKAPQTWVANPIDDQLQTIAGDNLLLNSGVEYVSDGSVIVKYMTSKNLVEGATYTFVCDYTTSGNQYLHIAWQEDWDGQNDGVRYSTFTFNSGNGVDNITLYNNPMATADANPITVRWSCLYEGDVKAPQTWVANPNDNQLQIAAPNTRPELFDIQGSTATVLSLKANYIYDLTAYTNLTNLIIQGVLSATNLCLIKVNTVNNLTVTLGSSLHWVNEDLYEITSGYQEFSILYNRVL